MSKLIKGRFKNSISMFVIGNILYDSRVQKEALILSKKGYEVTVFSLKDKGVKGIERIKGFKISQISLFTRPLPKTPIFWLIKYIEFVVKVIILGYMRKSAIYHAHDLNTLIPAYIVAKLRGAKLIYDSHELWSREVALPLPYLWKQVEKHLILKADAVIVANKERAKILEKDYKLGEKPIVVMNCPFYHKPIKSDKLPKLLNIDNKTREIVLYQGGIGRDRCAEELISACKYFKKGVILIFIGPIREDYQKKLAKKIKKETVGHKVYFLPPVPSYELPNYTSSANIGIVLYHNTSWNNYYCAPNKLFEYLMQGLPVIASNFPGMKEIVEGEQIGLCVNPTDSIQIAKAINEILDDKHKYKMMRRNALKASKEKYNWEIESQKLLKVYESLLEKLVNIS